MLCGIGFDGGVAHQFAREAKRGLRTYVKVTLSHFFRARCYSFRIDLPGYTSFPVEAFFIDIANGGSLVLEMGPEPNTKWGSDPAAAPPSMTE